MELTPRQIHDNNEGSFRGYKERECPGCKTVLRLPPQTLCSDCKETLREVDRVKGEVGKFQDRKMYCLNNPFIGYQDYKKRLRFDHIRVTVGYDKGFRYSDQECVEEESKDLTELFQAGLRMVATPLKTDWCWGNRNEEAFFPLDDDHRKDGPLLELPVEAKKYFSAMATAIKLELQEAYDLGYEHGRALLMGLADGTLSVGEYNEAVTKVGTVEKEDRS